MPFKDPEAKKAWRRGYAERQKASNEKYRASGKESARNAQRAAEREAAMSDYERAMACIMAKYYGRIMSIVAAMDTLAIDARKERKREKERQRRAANPELQRERDRRRKICPKRSAAKRHAYRARKNAADGSHSADDIEALVIAQGGVCNYCSKPWEQVDHMTPLVRGGGNGPDNLQLLCQRHNASKGAWTDAEYRRRMRWPSTGRPPDHELASNVA